MLALCGVEDCGSRRGGYARNDGREARGIADTPAMTKYGMKEEGY